MAQRIINIGTAEDDNTGDHNRVAWDKANQNFTELYAVTYQPLDGDLTSLAAAAGTNTIYYRSGTDVWSPVVVSTGLAFSGGNLSATVGAVISSVVIQKFTASGTYTPTAGMKYCIIECVGGGGGGGGVAGSVGGYFVGAGGGSGGYSRKRATAADVGASLSVTVGAAGNAGNAAPGNGGNGGATSVGALCIANGGGGGLWGGSGQVATPGSGASPGTGDITASGSPGMAGIYQSNTANVQIGPCGTGGSSVFGGGAAGISSSVAFAVGNSAGNYGGGGGGGSIYNSATNTNGGPGSVGIAIITEYI